MTPQNPPARTPLTPEQNRAKSIEYLRGELLLDLDKAVQAVDNVVRDLNDLARDDLYDVEYAEGGQDIADMRAMLADARRLIVAAGALNPCRVQGPTDTDARQHAGLGLVCDRCGGPCQIDGPYPAGSVAASTDRVHLVQEDSVVTRCCGTPVVELPSGERWTAQTSLVNCAPNRSGADRD